MGVFATRSTFRPNPIGMSLVELKGIRCQKDRVILELGSLDLVDGTPVIDIKPIALRGSAPGRARKLCSGCTAGGCAFFGMSVKMVIAGSIRGSAHRFCHIM